MSSFKRRIADVLVAKNLATPPQVEELMAESGRSGKSFARLLVAKELVSEATLAQLLSEELGLPMISLVKYRIDPAVARLIPERMARQYNLIALAKFGERLVVAMSDPLNIFAIDDLKALTQVAIDPVLASEVEIRRAIEQTYMQNQQAPAPEAEKAKERPEGGAEDDDGEIDTAVAHLLSESSDSSNDAPVVKVIDLMVIEAMRRRASDIHLEPLGDSLRVRYRIDGKLIENHRLPRAVQNPMLTRLKIMSGIDITESRIPQDGRFKVRLEDREVDFRVSILPLTHGGKAVLRLLDKANLSIGLDNLGFLPESIELFKAAVKRPHGLLLVTGPTGSGKSTTLYSILSQLNQPTKNLITVEDPVEYQVEGITQVQTNADVGLTFASGLRAILRQSPDIVMIGEIRDFETADIAMKASLTGQLVLSTLHTNDAASAVTRLIDMGVEPFLVASSVSLIEAQRLVRKLCQKCKEPYDPEENVIKRFGFKLKPGTKFYKPKGCRQCNSTGFRGRMGIIEVLQVDEQVREHIVQRVQSWKIKEYAQKQLGMLPLREDGLRKVELGLTTLEEVIGVTTEE